MVFEGGLIAGVVKIARKDGLDLVTARDIKKIDTILHHS